MSDLFMGYSTYFWTHTVYFFWSWSIRCTCEVYFRSNIVLNQIFMSFHIMLLVFLTTWAFWFFTFRTTCPSDRKQADFLWCNCFSAKSRLIKAAVEIINWWLCCFGRISSSFVLCDSSRQTPQFLRFYLTASFSQVHCEHFNLAFQCVPVLDV